MLHIFTGADGATVDCKAGSCLDAAKAVAIAETPFKNPRREVAFMIPIPRDERSSNRLSIEEQRTSGPEDKNRNASILSITLSAPLHRAGLDADAEECCDAQIIPWLAGNGTFYATRSADRIPKEHNCVYGEVVAARGGLAQFVESEIAKSRISNAGTVLRHLFSAWCHSEKSIKRFIGRQRFVLYRLEEKILTIVEDPWFHG